MNLSKSKRDLRLCPRVLRQLRRFTKKIVLTPETGCWLWTGATQPNGYGRFREGGVGSKVLFAHRFSYEMLVGPIPPGHAVDHLCRNPSCVNPRHLRPLPHDENTRRANSLRFHQMEPDALTLQGVGDESSPF